MAEKEAIRAINLKFKKKSLDWFQAWCAQYETTATATLARFINACERGDIESPFLVELNKYKELEERLNRLERSGANAPESANTA